MIAGWSRALAAGLIIISCFGAAQNNFIASTQISRTSVESTSKYSATPPHTPAILESIADRISRLAATTTWV